jgi:hypothetical protein
MSPSCQTLSNVLSMFRKTPTVHSPRLACLVMSVCSSTSTMGFCVDR